VSYEDLFNRLLTSDEYLLLADFDAYCDAERRMAETYLDRKMWNTMSLRNVARSGIFAADRCWGDFMRNGKFAALVGFQNLGA
jgi:starch phosphorylase